MISHWVWQDDVLILPPPFFCGLLTGCWLQVRLTDISGGNLVEGGMVDYHNHDDFSITVTLVSDEDDYSYCSITDAAQVQCGQCGRATMAANELHITWPSIWQMLARYLPSTCQVLGIAKLTCTSATTRLIGQEPRLSKSWQNPNLSDRKDYRLSCNSWCHW